MEYIYNAKKNIYDYQKENIKSQLLLNKDLNVKKVNFDNEKIIVNYENDNENIKKNIEAIIKQYDVDLALSPRIIHTIDNNINFCNLNLDTLKQAGIIIETSEGVYIYQGVIYKVIMALSNLFYDEIQKHFAPKDVYLPSLLNDELLNKCGYDDKKKMLCNRVLCDRIDKEDMFLSPAACLPLYKMLSCIPRLEENISYTSICKVFRKEPIGYTALKRLREYNVRELVIVANEKNIELYNKKLLDFLISLAKKLGLKGVVETACDIFFADEFKMKSIFQLAKESKVELKLYINEAETISVASINAHDTFFAKQWNIKNDKGDYIYTSCLGLGIERWCYAIIAQYGYLEEKWPDGLKNIINNNYKGGIC